MPRQLDESYRLEGGARGGMGGQFWLPSWMIEPGQSTPLSRPDSLVFRLRFFQECLIGGAGRKS